MEEMKKYMGRTGKDRIVIAVVGIICGGLGLMMLLKHSYVMGCVFAAVCLLLLFSAIFAGKQDARYIRALAEQGELNAAADDFLHAEEYIDGTLKLGQRYAFRKGRMEVLALRDMQNIFIKHEHDNTDNGIGAEHLVLFAGLSSGRSVEFCSIYGPQQEEALQTVLQALIQRKPHLEVR